MKNILNIPLEQKFDVSMERKTQFGEVKTDYKLIEKMFDLLPEETFKDPTIKWCDPCAGSGEFMIFLYKKLYLSLQDKIPEPKSRSKHIISNMLWMIEINPFHIPNLRNIFGEGANIIHQSFLDTHKLKVDIIVGNPPYNINGKIVVPTNTKSSKKRDGITIWPDFIAHSVNLLKNSSIGYLLFITPCIWMKKDHFFYNYMTNKDIIKINTLNSSETNAIFHGEAQTPTCYFLLKTTSVSDINSVDIFDKITNKYETFLIRKNNETFSLPLCAISIVNKFRKFDCYESLIAYKTNMRKGYKGLELSDIKDEQHSYINISSCKLRQGRPVLKINYSNIPCSYHKTPKLVFAHKMYGFPYLDIEGKYGISNRDNYVIKDYNIFQLIKIRDFFYTRLGMFMIEISRYRMRYFERHIFEILSEIICQITDVKDEVLFDIFNLDDMERKYVNNFHKKQYLKTIPP